jgi:nitrogenase molybdenum-iron protein beta chain
VFGGQSNLLQSIENIFTIYEPDLIAVHTTCLSETIGDDVPQIVDKARQEGKIPAGKHVISASTPSYVGTHVTGFSNMVKGMVKAFAQKTGKKNGTVNIIPGFVEPSDMEEVKRLAGLIGVKSTVFPDTSGVLNGPMTGSFKMYPDGGVTVDQLKGTGDAMGTLALGEWASADAARFLDSEFKVPCRILDLPIGLQATDRFVDALRQIAGTAVPAEIEHERGQLIDVISDMHQYFYRKKVALVGDPDQLIALTELLVSLDMIPVHIVSGTPGKKFEARIHELTKDIGHPVNVKNGSNADMFLLHQWMKQEPVDLIIGNTYCKYIARDEDTPLLRHGFPIMDRTGHQYFPTFGYKGTLRLLEKILDRLMDRLDRDAPEPKFELQM